MTRRSVFIIKREEDGGDQVVSGEDGDDAIVVESSESILSVPHQVSINSRIWFSIFFLYLLLLVERIRTVHYDSRQHLRATTCLPSTQRSCSVNVTRRGDDIMMRLHQKRTYRYGISEYIKCVLNQ